MARRDLLTGDERRALFGVPLDRGSLAKFYTVTAAIVYWNTLYMGRAVEHLRARGEPAPDDLLAHVAPLGWRHISLTGDYLWQNAAANLDRDGYRALNLGNESGARVA